MVVWRSGMSHGSDGATGSMDVADGDFLGADRCGASNPARPRSGTPRPAARPTSARPGLALAASFLEFPTHLEPRRGQHDARPRARQARSERARARTRRPECSDLGVGRLPGARPGLQRVPWPRDPPRNPGFAAGSVTGRVLAAGSSPRRPGSGQPPEVAADARTACCYAIVRIRRGFRTVSCSISAADTPRSRSRGRNASWRYV